MIEANEVSVNPKIKTITADIQLTMLEVYVALKKAFATDPDLLAQSRFPLHAGYLHDAPFVTLDPDWEIRWVLLNEDEDGG